MRTERAAARIETIMRSFPSAEATIKRPTMDDYGSATGATTNVGTVQCWCTGVNRPGKYIINDRGQTGDDEGGRWFAIIRTDDAPTVQRGDYVCIGDERFIIRAIVPDGVSRREFWHCEV